MSQAFLKATFAAGADYIRTLARIAQDTGRCNLDGAVIASRGPACTEVSGIAQEIMFLIGEVAAHGEQCLIAAAQTSDPQYSGKSAAHDIVAYIGKGYEHVRAMAMGRCDTYLKEADSERWGFFDGSALTFTGEQFKATK